MSSQGALDEFNINVAVEEPLLGSNVQLLLEAPKATEVVEFYKAAFRAREIGHREYC